MAKVKQHLATVEIDRAPISLQGLIDSGKCLARASGRAVLPIENNDEPFPVGMLAEPRLDAHSLRQSGRAEVGWRTHAKDVVAKRHAG